MVMEGFAVRFIQSIDLENAAALLSLQQLATIATQPVSYRIVDVAPFIFGISPTLIINGFLVCLLCTVDALIEWKYRTFCFYLRAKLNHLWLATLVLLLAWTTYMGMLAALALSAFEGPGYSANALRFTVGRFFAVWGTTTMTVLAAALWLLNWLLILPPDVLGLPSLFTIQPNIACILVAPELAPGFFKWIYALPFYNGAMLLRYILSGAYPHIGTNVGIILGEICVMAVLLYITIAIAATVLSVTANKDATVVYNTQLCGSTPCALVNHGMEPTITASEKNGSVSRIILGFSIPLDTIGSKNITQCQLQMPAPLQAPSNQYTLQVFEAQGDWDEISINGVNEVKTGNALGSDMPVSTEKPSAIDITAACREALNSNNELLSLWLDTDGDAVVFPSVNTGSGAAVRIFI
ncbi:hypothetical protein IWW48_004293 [Coemansia sp. RSA 1200]|nr:hypothetical protein IWW48_004293 [Coemansia sp. RSA 1200]